MLSERLVPGAADRFDTCVKGSPMRAWHAVALGALAMACASVIVHIVPPGAVDNVPGNTQWGDNALYIEMANYLLAGKFGAEFDSHFVWGYPAVVAVASRLIHISTISALTLVSRSSALGAIALASQLWGPRVAAAFAIVNFAWLQRATFGGSDPLYMLLLLFTLVCVRHNRWVSATTLASLSVLVRPVGILVLPALFIVLATRKQYRTLFLSFASATAIGIGYYIPVSVYLRNPLLAIQGYRGGWYGDWIVTFPLRGVVAALGEFDRPWWSTLYHGAWLTIALATILVTLASSQRRAFWAQYPVEWIFAALYLAFILSYNSYWVWLDAARLLLPATPFMLATFEPWLPRQVWSYVITAPLFAIASAIPVTGVAKILGMFS
jgi:hypothetical protein